MNQLDFFPTIESKSQSETNNLDRTFKIQGLKYIPNYISQFEHDRLLNLIDYSNNWSHELKRRVQHYGYKYKYTSRSIDASMCIGGLPDWCLDIAKRLLRENLTREMPDQVIVNEYYAGQGIAKHIDCEPCFGEIVLSLSLGSNCVMDFTHRSTREEVSILLEPRSLLILEGDARYVWYHGIASRKTDKINNIVFDRKRRVSITFRKVLLSSGVKTA